MKKFKTTAAIAATAMMLSICIRAVILHATWLVQACAH